MALFRKYPLGNYRFIVSIGVVPLSFSKVSNLSGAIDYDTIMEGGLNSHVHTFTKQKEQQHTLVLERGVTNMVDAALLKSMGLRVGGVIKMPVVILIPGIDGIGSYFLNKAYGFDEGITVKWELGDLDALSGEVLIERFEIAHSGLIEL